MRITLTITLLAGLIVGLLGGLAGDAWAFHEIESFSRAESGGGNGSFFTGSPRFKGYNCRICHTNTDDAISIGLEVNRAELLQGRYDLNTGYTFTVKLIGEHRGLQSAFNPNTFMLEIVDDEGQSIGDFLSGPAPVELVDERRVVAAEGFGEGETEWTFSWFSPRESAGGLTLYIAMLDGDGAGLSDRRFIDPLNDDVATMALRLCPTGETCPVPEQAAIPASKVACNASGRSAGGTLLIMLTLLTLRRRRCPRNLV